MCSQMAARQLDSAITLFCQARTLATCRAQVRTIPHYLHTHDIHGQRCDYTTVTLELLACSQTPAATIARGITREEINTRSHCWRNCTSPTNLQKASESRQGLVPSAGPFRCGPSERGEPHLLLAPPGPSPNGLRRSIRHAPTPTSAIPAMALRTEATQSASSMSQAALRPMRACPLAKHAGTILHHHSILTQRMVHNGSLLYTLFTLRTLMTGRL